MYENRYNLNSKPFSLAPTIQQYFGAESIHHALGQACISVEREAGPVIVTGAPGTGKSLLLAVLERHFSKKHCVVRLQCARLVERGDLLQTVLYELGLEYKGMSEGELRLALLDFLKSDNSQGLLLLVDEAHSLSTGLLDELRLITNFVRDGRQRVALVMAGSPALEENLIDTRSESFNQRIGARCYLTSLTQKETIEYVLTHIERAGGHGEELFTDQALTTIHQFSEGCPRVINQICDQSLIIAAQADMDRVSADVVTEAWNQVQSIPGSAPPMASAFAPIETVDDETVSAEGFDGAVEITGDVPAVTGDVPAVTGGDMIIEFGHLEPEGDVESQQEIHAEPVVEEFSASNESVESEQNESFVSLQVPDSAGIVGAAGAAVVAGVAGVTAFQSDEPPTSDEPSVAEEVSSLVDSCPEEICAADGGDAEIGEQVEAQPTFENPFEEVFSEEERIDPRYQPAVAEQNISSLTLKPDHLTFLDDIPSVSEIAVAPEMAGVALPTLNEVSDQIQKDDLDVSEMSISELQQLEAEVVRMQRESHTQEVRPDEPVAIEIPESSVGNEDAPEISIANEIDQPSIPFIVPVPESTDGVNQFVQAGAVADSVDSELPDISLIAQEIAEQTAATNSGTQPLIQSLKETQDAEDDRDMMVVEIPQDLSQPEYTVRNAIPGVPAAPVETSTGGAKRMNYEELFQQLRNQSQQ